MCCLDLQLISTLSREFSPDLKLAVMISRQLLVRSWASKLENVISILRKLSIWPNWVAVQNMLS